MKKFTTIAALSLAAALGLSACTSEAPADNPTASAPAAAIPAPTPEPAAEEPKFTTKAFGETFEYEDGISVTVAVAGTGMASATAAGAEETGGQIMMFDVTVANGSADVFDPATVYSEVTYGANAVPASTVFDSAQNLAQFFQGNILPGKSQTIRVAYAIPTDAPVEVVFTTTPTFSHKDAIFYGTPVAPTA